MPSWNRQLPSRKKISSRHWKGSKWQQRNGKKLLPSWRTPYMVKKSPPFSLLKREYEAFLCFSTPLVHIFSRLILFSWVSLNFLCITKKCTSCARLFTLSILHLGFSFSLTGDIFIVINSTPVWPYSVLAFWSIPVFHSIKAKLEKRKI